MCHQPFEQWIIEETKLNREDRLRLEEHLAECQQCRSLQKSWQAVHLRLSTARQVTPSEGFTKRWQMTLQKRLEEQRMKQVLQIRRFFLFLGTATVLSAILLVSLMILGGGFLTRLNAFSSRLAVAAEWIETLQGYLFAVLHFTPPAIPLILWVIASTVFSILALIWVVSFWRITLQGVKSR